MKLFPASPKGDNKLGPAEDTEMLAHRLAGHLKMLAKLSEGLAVVLVELVKQRAAAFVGQGFEHVIHGGEYATKRLHFKRLPLQIQRARPKIHYRMMRAEQLRPKQSCHRPRTFKQLAVD